MNSRVSKHFRYHSGRGVTNTLNFVLSFTSRPISSNFALTINWFCSKTSSIITWKYSGEIVFYSLVHDWKYINRRFHSSETYVLRLFCMPKLSVSPHETKCFSAWNKVFQRMKQTVSNWWNWWLARFPSNNKKSGWHLKNNVTLMSHFRSSFSAFIISLIAYYFNIGVTLWL